MNKPVTILGANGQPLAPNRASMLAGGSSGTPYDAADTMSPHMAEWRPALWSPDNELNMYRDRIVGRIRDLVRNDGWASGAVTRLVDNGIGANFRAISKPDYRALAVLTGIKGFDASWADEFGKVVDALYRSYCEDEGRYCDAARHSTMPQMYRLGFRHKMVDGDALAQAMWLPDRIGPGRARYATAFQMVDPDRLSNPQQRFDIINVRGGVEIDRHGAATHYHIRQAHAGDWFDAQRSNTWDRIPRETSWGRLNIIHDFDIERAGQHRGGVGVLGPVVGRLKALIKYDGAELDAAILNAIFAAYIESPNDPELVESALGASELPAYQQMRTAFHDEKRLSLNGARMPILFPGERINMVTAARPSSNFDSFEHAFLRNVASATGLTAQQVSQDWSKVNYSAHRGALIEAFKTMDRRRSDYAIGFAGRMRSVWLEEAFEVDDLPLPAGAPPYMEARASYARALWMGPPRGWQDPVAEKEGAILGMEAGLSTLEQECADQSQDWEEVLDQRAIEVQAFKARGLDLPASWLGQRMSAPRKEETT